ncbi:MAG: DinB family protein [Planctomycetes bacterium]|nr:DinB family protein [Planctomycetota bacterium]
MDIVDPIIAEFESEAATTRRMLERVPEKQLGWKPHAKSMSLGELASHIAHSFTWLASIVAQDELEFDPARHVPWVAASKRELLDAFDKNVAQGVSVLRGVPDKKMLAPWTMTTAAKKLFSMPRVAVVRMFTVNHHIHHRGQLSVYLRLRDVPLPQVYGSTADETDMIKPG